LLRSALAAHSLPAARRPARGFHFLPEYGLALTDLRRVDGALTFLTIHEMWGEFLCRDLLNRRAVAISEAQSGQETEQEPEDDTQDAALRPVVDL
jgi:hypothetical protein